MENRSDSLIIAVSTKRKNAAVEQFGVSGIPDNFLIGPDGIVIARGLRGDALMMKLEEIFKVK